MARVARVPAIYHTLQIECGARFQSMPDKITRKPRAEEGRGGFGKKEERRAKPEQRGMSALCHYEKQASQADRPPRRPMPGPAPTFSFKQSKHFGRLDQFAEFKDHIGQLLQVLGDQDLRFLEQEVNEMLV